MRISHIKTARAIWLVDSRDLNPNGIDITPVLDAIRVRYNFQVYPKTSEEVNEYDSKGIVFMNGSFSLDGSRYTVVKATMFNDGIVVDSVLSTDFCEAFLADALNFVSEQFGLTYTPDMIHGRLYISEMIVQSDKDLRSIFERFGPLFEKLRGFTGDDFRATGFQLLRDPAESGVRRAGFIFEREIGKPFAQNRYYASAPLKTGQHEEVLRDLEALL